MSLIKFNLGTMWRDAETAKDNDDDDFGVDDRNFPMTRIYRWFIADLLLIYRWSNVRASGRSSS